MKDLFTCRDRFTIITIVTIVQHNRQISCFMYASLVPHDARDVDVFRDRGGDGTVPRLRDVSGNADTGLVAVWSDAGERQLALRVRDSVESQIDRAIARRNERIYKHLRCIRQNSKTKVGCTCNGTYADDIAIVRKRIKCIVFPISSAYIM